MPIYAYRCQECGHAKDVIQKFSDAPLTLCPACGADAFRKQLTAPAFQLKGSGWYVTDFRDSGKGKPADAGTADRSASPPAGAEGGGSSGESAAQSSAGSGAESDAKSGAKSGAKTEASAASKTPAAPSSSAPASSSGSGTPGAGA